MNLLSLQLTFLSFFFFSSRRRHTRSLCDWSSDVCSSDLDPDQRFATAREFSQALKRAAEGKPAIPEEEPTLVVPREPRVQQPTHAPEALRSGEMELEFWRSIKDSDDANDFELYVRQFPQGVYASLAARKA